MYLRLMLVVTLFFAGCQGADGKREVTNSIGMKLVLIPKGTFQMGSPPTEAGRQDDERQHEVTLTQDYYLGAFEVTQAQYQQVMDENPSYFQNDEIQGDSGNHPVERVTWFDAVEFCRQLSELPEEQSAGRIYRLPTEAEWEYACRAGSKTAYSFGEDPKLLGDYAWYYDNSNDQNHPVGEKKPNAWGLYDMQGNVWEWCDDWYGEYPDGAVSDPTGPSEGSKRVSRGGKWGGGAAGCRSADRGGSYPSSRSVNIGFRVTMSQSGVPD